MYFFCQRHHADVHEGAISDRGGRACGLHPPGLDHRDFPQKPQTLGPLRHSNRRHYGRERDSQSHRTQLHINSHPKSSTQC